MNFKLLFVALVAAQLTGCAMVQTRAGSGALYTKVKDFTNVRYINTKTTKTGKACATNILGMILTGDMSLDKAKQDGNIRKVSTVDIEGSSILGLYSNVCLIARGN
ncbi:MAG: TRL-like family protein [Bdellovibrionales bacterium]|nr:TRL-like family protein [Bdellovibrionales bacterium]